MKTSYSTVLAFHIRDIRESLGITQAEIADNLKMTSAGWGKIESNKSTLSVENLMKFCKVAKCDASSLIDTALQTSQDLKSAGWEVVFSQVENDDLIIGRSIPAALSDGSISLDDYPLLKKIQGSSGRAAVSFMAISGFFKK